MALVIVDQLSCTPESTKNCLLSETESITHHVAMKTHSLFRIVDSRVAFVMRLLDLLTSEGIRYVLVGDVRSFPLEIPSDVDIVVENSSINQIPQTLARFCAENNAQIVQVLQHEQSAWYWVCVWTEKGGRVKFLHPDVCTDYFRDGVLFLKSHELLNQRLLVPSQTDASFSFFIPTPPKGFLYYLIKKVDKENISQKEGEFLSLVWKKDPKGAKYELARFWNNEIGELLARAADEEKWESVQENIVRIKRLLRKNRPFSIKHYCAELSRKVRRISQPTGLQVVFLGLDGTGKSTIISKVSRDLAPAFRNIRVHHFRPFLLEKGGNTSAPPLPHSSPCRGMVSSIGKLIWYLIDNTVGYLLLVFLPLIQSTLVIFDRHYYDLIIDPKRYRYGGPPWLVKLIGKLIPHPDLIFLLDASPQVINGRKQEIPIAEMVRLRKAYLQFVQGFKNPHVVDVSKPMEDVENEVKTIILGFLSKRTMQRLRL